VGTSFTKQEQVMFDKLIEGFDDMLVIAKGAELYQPLDAQEQVNARDKFWIPAPMIGASYDGFDQTANFDGLTQLNVPARSATHKSSPKTLSSKNLRNQLRWISGARRPSRSSPATSTSRCSTPRALRLGVLQAHRRGDRLDDVADVDVAPDPHRRAGDERMAFYAPSIMNAMAATSRRSEATERSQRLRARDDHSATSPALRCLQERPGNPPHRGNRRRHHDQRRQPAHRSRGDHRGGHSRPRTRTTATPTWWSRRHLRQHQGRRRPHHRRRQRAPPDHQAGHRALKTFRVVAKPAANTIRVYPAIIDAAEGSVGSKEYANVSATPANGAAITWLNTTLPR
jgi:hypothetical protein